MTLGEMREIISLVHFEDYTFEVKEGMTLFSCYLQASYFEPDIITGEDSLQKTRKWMLSRHMVKSEVVQTAFKCVITSLEHRAREHFLYRNERIFGPHFDVEALYEIAKAKRLDYRGRHAHITTTDVPEREADNSDDSPE